MFANKLAQIARNAEALGLKNREKYAYLLENFPSSYQQDDQLLGYVLFQVLAVLFEEYDIEDAPTAPWYELSFFREGEVWKLDEATAGMSWSENEHPLIDDILEMNEAGIHAICLDISFEIFRDIGYVLPGYDQSEFGPIKDAVKARMQRIQSIANLAFRPALASSNGHRCQLSSHKANLKLVDDSFDYDSISKEETTNSLLIDIYRLSNEINNSERNRTKTDNTV